MGEKRIMRLVLEGIGLLLLGFFNIIWSIAIIISSIIIATLVCTRLGLVNQYWWAGVILIITIIFKLVSNNSSDKYNEMVDKYHEKVEETEDYGEMW